MSQKPWGQKPWGSRRQTRARRILKRCSPREEHPDQFLLPLRVGEELSIAGTLEVRVVRGCAEIWGATLRPSAEFVKVVAPSWAALPRIHAITRHAGSKLVVNQDLHIDEPDDIQLYLKEHTSAVILCLREKASVQENAESPKKKVAALLPPAGPSRLRVHPVWPSLLDRLVGNHGSSQSQASDELATAQLLTPMTLLVMGPKGVGKSSCCRYFVNALLSHFGEVCYLETDLGQPELGAPGLVSLHRVKNPLLKVAHCEQYSHECIASFFGGGVTPGVHPELFVRCVRAAFEEYQKLRSASGDKRLPPLVVNSHGWAAGLGFELTRTVLEIVRAQLVVRLQTAPPKRKADEEEEAKRKLEEGQMTSSPAPAPKRARTALSRCGPLAMGLRSAAGTQAQSHSGYVLVDVQSVVSSDNPDPAPQRQLSSGSLTAVELRWLRFACYFRPDIDPCERPSSSSMRKFLSPVPRYRLCLNDLSFGMVNSAVSPGEVEAAFTGTVVALCRATTPPAPSDDASLKVLPHLETVGVRCMALAFVHSFDFSTGELVLHTPVKAEALSEVNAVMRGDIDWQPHHAPRGPSVASVAAAAGPWQPYFCMWSLEEMGAGTRVISTRGNVFRKKHMKNG